MERPIMFWKARITFTFSFIDLSATLKYEKMLSLQEFLQIREVRVKEDYANKANDESHIVVLLKILEECVLCLLGLVVI
jgi:hypothetical protein